MEQLWIIHGGDVCKSDEQFDQQIREKTLYYERLRYRGDWKSWLRTQLPAETDLLMPSMPAKDNAKYEQWATIFDKCVPFIEGEVTLVGHSLGGVFLARYLSENTLPTKVGKLCLIAAPFREGEDETLGGFQITDPKKLQNIYKSANEIHLFHSHDDFVVPYSAVEEYSAALPDAHVYEFDDKFHFVEPEFPELLDVIIK